LIFQDKTASLVLISLLNKKLKIAIFKIHFRSRPEVMATHDITLCHYTMDRSLTPESFIELSVAVLEIIRGQI
jgi:hypothetical protein